MLNPHTKRANASSKNLYIRFMGCSASSTAGKVGAPAEDDDVTETETLWADPPELTLLGQMSTADFARTFAIRASVSLN